MAKKPCAASGCWVLLDLGVAYCPKHTAQDKADRDQYSKERRTTKPSVRWYSLAAWRNKENGKRVMQLAKQPYCKFCDDEGRTTRATVADHIEPHREDYGQFWHGALQSLCVHCHASPKQRMENRSGGVSESP